MSNPRSPDEIAAEIADHLATAAERLQARGVAPGDAQQQAQQQFGDAAAIGRRCYWIQHGDSLMFRYAVIALLSILCLGLTITAIASWRSQARMAEQMTTLTEELRMLAAKQAAPVPAPVPAAPEQRPLEIVGTIYDGSPDKPLAGWWVDVVDVKDGRELRSVKSDSTGAFSSGPLPGGDYSLVSRMNEKLPEGTRQRFLQTAPISAYPGVKILPQDIDVAFRAGSLAIETSRPLPKLTVDDRYILDTRLLIRVEAPQERPMLWSVGTSRRPEIWPILASSVNVGNYRGDASDGRQIFELLTRERIDNQSPSAFTAPAGRFFPGTIRVAAAIIADVWPVDYQPPAKPEAAPNTQGGASWRVIDLTLERNLAAPHSLLGDLRSSNDLTFSNDDYYWSTKGLGKIWRRKLLGDVDASDWPYLISREWVRLDMSPPVVAIENGVATRIRIEVPEDLEMKIEQLLTTQSDPNEFVRFTLGESPSGGGSRGSRGSGPRRQTEFESPFLRETKITVVGTRPLQEPARDSAQ